MSAAQEIKERIASIQSTMKITNAMYLISSTKLNTARAELAKTEPYFDMLEAMFARILRHLPEGFSHPYLDTRATKNKAELRRAILCVTADKGLAGSYNHSVIQLTQQQLRPDNNDMLFVIGEVGRDYFSRTGVQVDETFHYTAQNPTLARSRQIASRMLELFENGKVDEVYLVYTRMKNSMDTQTQCINLLPLERLGSARLETQLGIHYEEDFKLVPDAATLLNNIIPDYLGGYIYSALVESFCAEHSCRMQAMDAANRNGQALLDELSLAYNHERQAAITQEITEVAAGARAREQQKARLRARRKAAAEDRKKSCKSGKSYR